MVFIWLVGFRRIITTEEWCECEHNTKNYTTQTKFDLWRLFSARWRSFNKEHTHSKFKTISSIDEEYRKTVTKNKEVTVLTLLYHVQYHKQNG